MKKTVIRVIATALCLIVVLSSLVACDMVDSVLKTFKKEEIPATATYEFSTVQNVSVKNSEELANEIDTLTSMYKRGHYVLWWDSHFNMDAKIDTVSCKDGTITFTHYYGIGAASFMNGGSVYSEYGTNVYTLGTYSGKNVTIDENVQENEYYTDAYLTEDGFIICVEETDSEGVVIQYELVFESVDAQ